MIDGWMDGWMDGNFEDDGWMEEEKKRKKMKKIKAKMVDIPQPNLQMLRHSSNSIFCSVILSIALSFDSYFTLFFLHIF